MNNILRRLWNDSTIFLLCCLVIFGVAYGFTLRNFLAAPTDRFYWGNNEYPLDMVGNLTFVQEGYLGHWQAFVKYTTKFSDEKSFLKLEYILIGHMARIFHLDTTIAFYLTRTLISLGYVLTIFFLARKLFSQKHQRIIAILLTFFSACFAIPGKENIFNKTVIHDALLFQRFTSAAHHYMISGMTTLLSLYCIAEVFKRPSNKRAFVIAIITGFISSFVYAPNGVMILLSLPFFVAFLIVQTYRQQRSWKTLLTPAGILFGYAFFVLLPILYIPLLRMTIRKDLPINYNMEAVNPFHLSFIQYLLGMGITFFFSFFSLPTILKKGQPFFILLAAWLIIHPLGEFVLADYLLGINRIRFFLMPYFVIFAFLATIGINTIATFVAQQKQFRSFVIQIILVGSVFVTSAWSYADSIHVLPVCFCSGTFFDYGYPKKEYMDAFLWLKKNTKEDDIVLSDTFAGTLIPAFAGNRVYESWWYRLTGLPEFVTATDYSRWFFMGKMSPEGSHDFLSTNNISYILYGEYEQMFRPHEGILPYTNIEEVYQNGKTRIYKVKK